MVTEYSGLIPDGRLAADEQTLTIRPQPRSAMLGAAARMARNGASTFSSQAACQSSSGTSSMGAPLSGAGVVDQHVEAVEALRGSGGHPLAGVGGGDVERQARGLPARPGALGGRLLDGFLGAGHDQHPGPLGAQAPSDLEADSPAGAGDHARPALQAEIHQRAAKAPYTSSTRSVIVSSRSWLSAR